MTVKDYVAVTPKELDAWEFEGDAIKLLSMWGVNCQHEVWVNFLTEKALYIVRPVSVPSTKKMKAWQTTVIKAKWWKAEEQLTAVFYAVREAENELRASQDRKPMGIISVTYGAPAPVANDDKEEKPAKTTKATVVKKKTTVAKKTPAKPLVMEVGAKVKFADETLIGKVTKIARKNATVEYPLDGGTYELPIDELTLVR